MPNWKRAFVPGGTFFFTVVTDCRRPIFQSDFATRLLGEVLRECQFHWQFEIKAIVLLPDHLHTIWALPRSDANFSKRWAWTKSQFTKRWLAQGGTQTMTSEGRKRNGRKGVWQPKFWEHCLKDEYDFERHFDYIHYNPVKHGYVDDPKDWPFSSLKRLT